MLSFLAFALQAAFNSSLHTTYLNNPNIRVPASTAVHWYDLNKIHTHCLEWVGPDPRGISPEVDALNVSGPLVTGFPPGFHPSDIRNAYNVTLSGAQAICVIDNGHLPTALADFNTFSAEFGLPQETSTNPLAASNKVLQIVYDNGTLPPSDVTTGWDVEETIDMEWAHAVAPNAKIYVLESATGNLTQDNPIAAALLGVKEVSNSWGYPNEFGTTQLQLDSNFTQNGVVFLASAGDIGAVQSWPATSTNVVSVGGTSLFMNGSVVTSEVAWPDSGGGPSQYEARPTWQNIPSVISQVSSHRGNPDVAAVADTNTGVAVYSSSIGGWQIAGGTSVACPIVAAIINTTGTFYSNTQTEENLIYSLLGTSSYRDIVTGTTTTNPFSNVSYTAHPGWDFITGCGAPLNLSKPVVSYLRGPDAASSLTGNFVGTTLDLTPQATSTQKAQSLASTDGNYYIVTGVPFSTLGSTADVRAHFTFPAQAASLAAEATVTVTANASTNNVINEIFLYNSVTKNYDLMATPILTNVNQTFSFTLSPQQAPNYVDNSGNVVVLSRALLPQRSIVGSNAGYRYNVDQIHVTYGFFQPQG